MKYFIPLSLFAAAGVSAQDPNCAADFIVTQCLATEQAKINACGPTDYDCQCAAYQAVATCYNNCPADPRAAPARSQVTIYCGQASAHGSKALASRTDGVQPSSAAVASSAAGPVTSGQPAATSSSGNIVVTSNGRTTTIVRNTATFSSNSPQNTNAAGELVMNTGGAVAAVAGVIAALL